MNLDAYKTATPPESKNWIHVDERKPKDGQVIWANFLGTVKAIYEGGKFFDYNVPDTELWDVELWQPCQP